MRTRRMGRAGGVAGAVVALLVAAGCTGGPAPHWGGGGPSGPTVTASTPAGPTKLVVRRLAVALPAPLSDPVVFLDGTTLLVAGGLTAQDTSSAAVVRVDPAGGRADPAGRLVAPVHDAAGATLGDLHLLFGGGTSASVATVETVRPGQTARITGTLPEPRSDLAAAVSGGHGYLVGGYTGTRMLASVLETADGLDFHPVATLPVPVRYPAVATAGGRLWVLGGLTGAGAPTDAVQRVDLDTGTAQVVGHLPRPLSHAAGFALGTGVYLAGGRLAGDVRSDAILRVEPDGTTSRVGTLPVALSDAGVAVGADVAYLVGGQTPVTVADIVTVRATSG